MKTTKTEIIVSVIVILLFGVVVLKVIPDIIGPPEFSVQDAWVYCCDHPEVNITDYGDNCTRVIDYVYNGMCYKD